MSTIELFQTNSELSTLVTKLEQKLQMSYETMNADLFKEYQELKNKNLILFSESREKDLRIAALI